MIIGSVYDFKLISIYSLIEFINQVQFLVFLYCNCKPYDFETSSSLIQMRENERNALPNLYHFIELITHAEPQRLIVF